MDEFGIVPGAAFSDDEFYRLCFEYSTDIVYLLNHDMTVLSVSPSVQRVLGYDPEECIGLNFCTLNKIAPQITGKLSRDFQFLLSGIRIKNREFACYTNEGKELVFEVNGHPIYRNSAVRGVIVTARDITPQKRYETELNDILCNLRKSLDVTIKTISRTIDSKDPYTAGHQQRVSDLARAIGSEMGLSQDCINGIRMAGIVHDIGKISIPSEILSKPGRLHCAELELIKIHPIIGFDILSSVDFPWPVAAAVLQHHERVNGSGYPYGISGTYILPEAKILAVADVVEALATHRPYRASVGVEVALDEVENKIGTLYDGDVVDACLSLFRNQGYALTL